MKKKIINIIIIIILSIITINILLGAYTPEDFNKLKDNLDKYFIALALMTMTLNWISEGIIIILFANSVDMKMSFLKSMKYCLIGRYYNLITPFYSGGQPAQAYLMTSEGYEISKTTSILFYKFIVYQVVLTGYSLFMITINIKLILGKLKTAIPLVTIGLILNLGLIILISVLFLNKNIFEKMIFWGIRVAHRLKVVKDLERVNKKALDYFQGYYESLRVMWKDKALFFETAFFSFIQMTAYYFITYCIYRSLGLNKATPLQIMSMQAILNMSVVFIPTPGTAGAAEGGFYLLYRYYFTGGLLPFAIFTWRLIVYYLNIFISGIVLLYDYINKKFKK
ncbi:MAG: lysylphosphatidylglycerol synthase transmembrane domain-containing protein [Eubacteriales bacterium]